MMTIPRESQVVAVVEMTVWMMVNLHPIPEPTSIGLVMRD